MAMLDGLHYICRCVSVLVIGEVCECTSLDQTSTPNTAKPCLFSRTCMASVSNWLLNIGSCLIRADASSCAS